jgi:hypothetical protein
MNLTFDSSSAHLVYKPSSLVNYQIELRTIHKRIKSCIVVQWETRIYVFVQSLIPNLCNPKNNFKIYNFKMHSNKVSIPFLFSFPKRCIEWTRKKLNIQFNQIWLTLSPLLIKWLNSTTRQWKKLRDSKHEHRVETSWKFQITHQLHDSSTFLIFI